MAELRPLGLDGVVEIVPRRIADARGWFSEVYNRETFDRLGIETRFVQDNQSFSRVAGVLRGLHYQIAPRAQAKLVRVVRGAIFDVAVDIRRGSPTFRRWVSLEVSAEKGNQVLIPPGFAHGFLALADATEVVYKVSDGYSPDHERAIRHDDPDIGIAWPAMPGGYLVSDKDRAAPALADADLFD